MSSQALEHIIEEVNILTPEERQQLLAHLERDRRTADLRRIQGKYVGVKTSRDSFAARKAEEIELEDRPRR